MFGIEVADYSAVVGKSEQECKDKVQKFLELGKITEVVEEAHPMRRNSTKCDWVTYVR